MRQVTHTQRFWPALMLLSAIGACSADSGIEVAATPPSADVTTLQSSLIQTSIPLGAPYHPTEGVISADPNDHCIAHDTEVVDATDQRFKAAYIFEERDVALKLESLLNEELDTRLDPSLLQAATEAVTGSDQILPDSPQRMVLLAVRVNTVSRRVVLPGELNNTEHCDVSGGGPDENGVKFIQRCGTQYLAQEDLGGYLFVGVNLTAANREQVQSIHEQLLVGLNQREGIAQEAMDAIASQLGQDVALKVVPWGLQGVRGDIVPPSRWGDYINTITTHYQAALQNGELESTNYGATIGQRFDYYTAPLLNACGVPYSVQEAFACFNNMFSGTYNPRYPGPTDVIVAELEWLIGPGADRVIWDNFEGPNGERPEDMVRQLLGTIQSCLRGASHHQAYDISLLERECARVISAPGRLIEGQDRALDWHLHVCRACRIQNASCEVPEILAEYNALPGYRIATPLPELPPLPLANEVAETYWKGASSSTEILHQMDSHLCVWSGLQGKMEGGGEEAVVYPDLSSDEWKMRVRSGQSGNGTIHAGALCTLKDNFWDSKTPTEWTTPVIYDAAAQSGAPDTTTLGRDQFFSTLSGIKGRMRGTGEQATVTQEAPASRLKVESLQGALRAWATTVGTLVPWNGTKHSFMQLPAPNGSSGTVEVVNITTSQNPTPTSRTIEYVEYKLAPADEALCYLTNIGGKFDGGGERVHLEQRNGYWHIKASAGCDKWGDDASANRKHCSDWKQVVAQARCVAYKQRPSY